MEENVEYFQSSVQRLVDQIFKHIDISQCCTNLFDDISPNQVKVQTMEILTKTQEFIQFKLDSGRCADEIVAAAVYIAMTTMNIDIQMAMRQIEDQKEKILSNLQSFQRYIDLVEVFWSSCKHQPNSSNLIACITTSEHCIQNVVEFLVLCDELLRTILLSDSEETCETYRKSFQTILNIEGIYIDACLNATMMDMLMKVDIWGREWKPELLEKPVIENFEQNNSRKRRRIDDYSDDEYIEFKYEEDQLIGSGKKSQITKSAFEQRNELRNSIKELIQNQLIRLVDEMFQKRTSESDNEINIELTTGINDKSNNELIQTTNPITSNQSLINNSPLAQLFELGFIQLPFFVVCRQEELKQVALIIFSQPNRTLKESKTDQQKKNKENNNRNCQMRKLDETVQMIVNQQIFGKKAIQVNQSINKSQSHQQQSIPSTINCSNDLITCLDSTSEQINLIKLLSEKQEGRSLSERWIMPNYQSEQLSELVQSVINELEQNSPSKAKEVNNKFRYNNQLQGSGQVPLNLSRDLLAFAHNVTGQHITNINKKIFIENNNIFSKIGPKWCVNPFGRRKTKNERNITEIQITNTSDAFEVTENDEQLSMQKKKRKRQDYEEY
ncbi:MAG: hypothetical protein EZS28_012388 [Streblomastix strix]|uniref:Uncharacterized protein n=1 Tax=Streblomastix strix TaxID=222440 RepID=A0A5J4WAV8_9EUKA|nr:MAG: hypothetical protein EZS28_012388 [Streblomastix strix]